MIVPRYLPLFLAFCLTVTFYAPDAFSRAHEEVLICDFWLTVTAYNEPNKILFEKKFFVQRFRGTRIEALEYMEDFLDEVVHGIQQGFVLRHPLEGPLRVEWVNLHFESNCNFGGHRTAYPGARKS